MGTMGVFSPLSNLEIAVMELMNRKMCEAVAWDFLFYRLLPQVHLKAYDLGSLITGTPKCTNNSKEKLRWAASTLLLLPFPLLNPTRKNLIHNPNLQRLLRTHKFIPLHQPVSYTHLTLPTKA